MSTTNKLWEWFSHASIAERHRLATLCKSSVASIRWAAKNYRSKSLSADFAARIEEGVSTVNLDSPTPLPDVGREDLCETCRKCPYQIACNQKD